jgi:Tripartite tricarboxylate transporter family receptor
VHGDTWFWLTGPKNLPPEIVEKLNREVRRIVKTPKVRDYFTRQAALAMDVDVAGLNTFLAGEVAYWGALAKSIGLSVQIVGTIGRKEHATWTPSQRRTGSPPRSPSRARASA